jgi:hypothetical protein
MATYCYFDPLAAGDPSALLGIQDSFSSMCIGVVTEDVRIIAAYLYDGAGSCNNPRPCSLDPDDFAAVGISTYTLESLSSASVAFPPEFINSTSVPLPGATGAVSCVMSKYPDLPCLYRASLSLMADGGFPVQEIGSVSASPAARFGESSLRPLDIASINACEHAADFQAARGACAPSSTSWLVALGALLAISIFLHFIR